MIWAQLKPQNKSLGVEQHMLYAVTYELVGISGPGGSVARSEEEVVRFAQSLAEVALDQLGDAVPFADWYDLEGNDAKPRALLLSSDMEEVRNVITQISDQMKAQGQGYIDFWEYSDIFELVCDQQVELWCTSSLKKRIAEIRKEYYSIVHEISDEWANV